ncbi:uncharacterized protein [Panulirus ornatus]|uniref:uncharacterized protein isoform X2 n=1 Tax=Panulirus ornatus TaxID=150431 RepID=UPI003A8B673E
MQESLDDMEKTHKKENHSYFKAQQHGDIKLNSVHSLDDESSCKTSLFSLNNEKKFGCEECGEIFIQAETLIRHKLKHSDKLEQKFDNATKRITFKQEQEYNNVVEHLGHSDNLSPDVYKHSDKRLIHEKCEEQFDEESKFQHHIVLQSHDKKFECEKCGKLFSHMINLEKHRQMHSVKFHKYDEPEEYFANKSHSHLHEQSNIKFRCLECGKVFTLKSSLKTHFLAAHSGVKKFACKECGKAFSLNSYLNAHMVVHTGKKKFSCNDCGKLFTQKGSLNTHLLLHKDNGKRYECKECGKVFNRNSNLTRHMGTHSTRKLGYEGLSLHSPNAVDNSKLSTLTRLIDVLQ